MSFSTGTVVERVGLETREAWLESRSWQRASCFALSPSVLLCKDNGVSLAGCRRRKLCYAGSVLSAGPGVYSVLWKPSPVRSVMTPIVMILCSLLGLSGQNLIPEQTHLPEVGSVCLHGPKPRLLSSPQHIRSITYQNWLLFKLYPQSQCSSASPWPPLRSVRPTSLTQIAVTS